jgi:2-polyprenyl-3-methyl-5-hydroxy-6-metoxy-1,4-benzoquinol methylase
MTSVISAAAMETIAFYDRNASRYFEETAYLHVQGLYEPFLNHVPVHGRILDAGCGSGRDTKAFSAKGYHVRAIDASEELVRLAAAFTSQHCELGTLQEIDYCEEFDGIWACASLLHIPKSQVCDVIARLIKGLKPRGVLYCSLKEGVGERVAEDGRLFSYYDARSFRKVLSCFQGLHELSFWKTEEMRSHHRRGPWLNFLLKKEAR